MIVAAYHRARQILPTLSCFLAQTHQNFEVLVVHDGPGDGRVRESVELFGDDRFRYLELSERRQDGGNPAKAWGSLQATGDWIGHSNDDNYYAPVYFEAMLDALLCNDAQFVFCNMIHSHQGWTPFDTEPARGESMGEAGFAAPISSKRLPGPPTPQIPTSTDITPTRLPRGPRS